MSGQLHTLASSLIQAGIVTLMNGKHVKTHLLRTVNLSKRKPMLSIVFFSRNVRKTVTSLKTVWSINPKWLCLVEPKVRKIDTISKKVCSTFPIVLQRIFIPYWLHVPIFPPTNTTVIRLALKVMEVREEKFERK